VTDVLPGVLFYHFFVNAMRQNAAVLIISAESQRSDSVRHWHQSPAISGDPIYRQIPVKISTV